MQPTALSTAVHAGLQTPPPSARIPDDNGWYMVADNPLSREGVFEYLGSELPGAPDPTAIYRVYRPASELSDPATLESFNLIPLVDEHTWLGQDGMPAEQKGVHGTTGAGAYFDGEFLRNALKITSHSCARAIETDKRQLSAGYRCAYDWTPGVWNGQPYDAVQRQIRGNHIALVREGRSGPEVAVLDRKPFITSITFDSLEFRKMADSPTVEELAAQIATLMPLVDQIKTLQEQLGSATTAEEVDEVAEEAEEQAGEVIEAAEEVEAAAEAVESTDVEEAEEEELASALDKAEKTLDAKARKLKPHARSLDAAMRVGQARLRAANARNAKRARAMDRKLSVAMDTAVTTIGDRDALAKRLFPAVGVFDHAPMTYTQVQAYGAEKLGIPATALDAYLKGRESAPSGRAQDSAPQADAVSRYLNPKKD